MYYTVEYIKKKKVGGNKYSSPFFQQIPDGRLLCAKQQHQLGYQAGISWDREIRLMPDNASYHLTMGNILVISIVS